MKPLSAIQFRGFTLIEVLAAMAIFSLVAVALTNVSSQAARVSLKTKQKTLAQWVASNKLVEMQVYQKWPRPGIQDDKSEMAGLRWKVRTRISAGPFPDTLRLDIEVREDTGPGAGEQPVDAVLVGLLANPNLRPSEGTADDG